MNLNDIIDRLDTQTVNKDEEYQYTSEFLEWFYLHIYRRDDTDFPALRYITSDPDYEMMRKLCYFLVNVKHSKNFSNVTRNMLYTDMKKWLINAINRTN